MILTTQSYRTQPIIKGLRFDIVLIVLQTMLLIILLPLELVVLLLLIFVATMIVHIVIVVIIFNLKGDIMTISKHNSLP